MKKVITIVVMFILVQTVNAQRTINGLIKAEKDFAAYSVANSTKEAFLKFLDSNGLVFDKGKAVKGIESGKKREKRPGILNWHPQFAEISASGDFGYTTGPWTFQLTINDTIVARGQYTTVWHINKDGDWKFLVDLGVNNTPVETDSMIYSLDLKIAYHSSIKSMLKAEKSFILQCKDSVKAAYSKNIGGLSVLNRNNMHYQLDAWHREAIKENIQYSINGSGIASSRDIGYVYGTTIIDGKTDNYLRIWRRDKSGWKIAVEVLRY
jgi:ketosteroid isomerase-like protein